MKVHQKHFIEISSIFFVFKSQKHEFKRFEYFYIELKFLPSHDTATVVTHNVWSINTYE